MRLMQVALEKSVGDNVLPFIKEQTMTNTELEVAKRMDKVSATISQSGSFNVNLDLSKWNQLQRHDLNKYLFKELDELHGRENLYYDSHLWFNRCMILLGSRLTPPEIGPGGEPLPGDFCHYDQYGGLEGMRQKAWTITTIMIIKEALDQCGIKGETMGQGDNQVIHVKLNEDQQCEPQKYITMLLGTLDTLFRAGGLKLKVSETWYSQNLFEYSKIRFYKQARLDDSLKRLNRLIPDINEGFPSLASYLTCTSTCIENLSRNNISPLIPFFTYSLETAGNIFQRKNLTKNDNKLSLLILLNFPSVFGGLPISNMYQHSQRGCPDNLSIWVKIWQTLRDNEQWRGIYRGLLHIAPCKTRGHIDPVTLVEDIYSLNISGLPNYERQAREVIENYLPKIITNPQVTKLLGATRDDLQMLCSSLITMRPYMANLAHEILRNSTEGVQLQLLGSFTNVQTINRMINSDGHDQSLYQMGKEKDAEATIILKRRLKDSEMPIPDHIVERNFQINDCTYKIAFNLRKETWGFEIEGVTSPVPCEQIAIVNFDSLPPREKTNCIVAQTSNVLRTKGADAMLFRGPFPPYLGSSTPEKMMKPKLTVINPNPTTKSIMKLYYIKSYLNRMNHESNIIPLLDSMITQKLQTLPPVFAATEMTEWCGINYGGSYEHRFKASSQKRSALYSLSTILATHININTNQLGQALRGQEDYNLFFQELFLFIQNYCAESAVCGLTIPEEYGVPLMCHQCTYQIQDPKVQLATTNYTPSMQYHETHPSTISDQDKEHYIRTCVAAMSVDIGRKVASVTEISGDVHETKESIGLSKTTECTDRLASNLMTEFRFCDINYFIIGIMQQNKDVVNFIEGQSNTIPREIFDHFAYLILNSGRSEELFHLLEVPPNKHSTYTQTGSLAITLAECIKKRVKKYPIVYYEAALLVGFSSDTLCYQQFLWRTFTRLILVRRKDLTRHQREGIRAAALLRGNSIEEWHNNFPELFKHNQLLRFKIDQQHAIPTWRDMKQDMTELVGPILKLTEEIDRKERVNKVGAPPLSISRPFRDVPPFSFSSSILKQLGAGWSPIWVRHVHHIARPLGRISTAASKMYEVLGSIYPQHLEEVGTIVTLAEGSGGILSLLAHMYPRSPLIYNTLQDDSVEIKGNILNISPPALVGDQCRPSTRLVGLQETCMGTTDITKEAFVDKLVQLLDRLRDEGKRVSVISMNAELKTDIDNHDKILTYLPIMRNYLQKGGLFINKMFLRSKDQIESLTKSFSIRGFDLEIVKPASSHPHNQEFYVVGRLTEPEYSRFYGLVGEENVGEYLLKSQSKDKQLLSLKEYRTNYMDHLYQVATCNLYKATKGHPCLWSTSLKGEYNPADISLTFLHPEHQANIMCLLLQIEEDTPMFDHEGIPTSFKFTPKDELAALLLLSMLTSHSKDSSELVNVLDMLSVTRITTDIIVNKHVRLGVNSLNSTIDEEMSIIFTLGDKMKDYFRALPHMKSGKECPPIRLRTSEFRRDTICQMTLK